MWRVIPLLFLLACSTGTSTSSYAPPAFDMTGTWSGWMDGLATTETFTLYITQSGNSLVGTYINGSGLDFNVSGVISGDYISITLYGNDLLPGYKAFCDGSFSDVDNAAGSWHDTDGNEGDWGAARL